MKRALKYEGCCLREEGPGLKPLVFAWLLSGLRPGAPSQEATRQSFPQRVKPLLAVEKFEKAVTFLHDQLALQTRTASGGYWDKKIYPNQIWVDGAYMGEAFRAAYAATFQEPGDFDDIAKQLLLMDEHMRDSNTGLLLRHGWDESKQMAWADKTTGLSPEVWARAMGWYAMALVDVLDWFPKDHPERGALIAALNRTNAAIAKVQDAKTGLWWQVVDKGDKSGNYLEASASCMFVYSLARRVRLGHLPQIDEAVVKHGWEGMQKACV